MSTDCGTRLETRHDSEGGQPGTCPRGATILSGKQLFCSCPASLVGGKGHRLVAQTRGELLAMQGQAAGRGGFRSTRTQPWEAAGTRSNVAVHT